MSQNTIRMNFVRAKQKASDLEEVARDLERLANEQLNSTLSDLSGYWVGENSRKYINKGNQLQENLTDTARKLRDTARTIREIARQIYEAEMEAWRIAQERTSSN